MKKLIVCPKTVGNTYAVCDYVSRNLGVKLKVVGETTEVNLEGYDIVILASGVYANHVHKNIRRWINNLQSGNIKPNIRFYIFLTWIGRGKSDEAAFKELKRMLGEKGIKPEDNYMKCFGKGMGIVRSSHPNKEDYTNVLSWVEQL